MTEDLSHKPGDRLLDLITEESMRPVLNGIETFLTISYLKKKDS